MRLRNLVRRLVRGPQDDPRCARPLLLVLLGVTAGLYLWDLGASGWANAYYSAAVQGMTKSWKAFFFGSFDSASFITVDKTPASLWVMAISARIFGVNAWSILAPQALAGVASVGLLYAAMRRWARSAALPWAGPSAGLIAGAALALTPAAALMFRFNNPDALLVLLLVGAAYATICAVDSGRTWWLVAAGALVGAGFMTGMLQAFLIIPVLVLVYAVAGKPRLLRRIWQIALAGVAVVVSAGWWVAVVELWPKASRPYIGGSQTNSIVELIFGYNGLGRLTGNETGSVGGTGGGIGVGQWGATGITRLFQSDWGGQIAWFAVTAVVFSYGAGIIHQYYAVALAPAIGALVGIGAATLWARRDKLWSRLTLAVTLAGTAAWAFVLLDRSADWLPALRYAILAGGVAVALALVVAPLGRRALRVSVVTAGLLVMLAGPAAYAIDTVVTPHTGSIPLAGPTVAGAAFGPGGGQGGPGGAPGGTPPSFATRQGAAQGSTSATAGQMTPPARAPTYFAGGQGVTGDGGGMGGGAIGGLLDVGTPSADLVALLQTDAGQYAWAAAAVGANSAAGFHLAADEPVLAIGGFNGSDPAPTLAQFKELVNAGRILYFLGGGSGQGGQGGTGGGMGGSGSSSEISSSVSSTFSSTTVGGVTVYDLTSTQ